MRLNSFTIMFWSFWLGIIAYLFLGVLANLTISTIQTGVWQPEPLWRSLPLIGMFAFGYLLVMVSFKIETDHNKEFLAKLAETKTENIQYIDKIFGLTEFQIIMSLLSVAFAAGVGWIVFNLRR